MQTPAFIGEAMMEAVRAGHVFYTYQNGIPELREALSDLSVADWANGRSAPERIRRDQGGMHAIQIALELILGAR